MARQRRIQFKDALYHVISRGNERRDIFIEDADRIKFLKIFNNTVERFNWLIHAFCLMNNHNHLMIETPEANLANGMKYLNQLYSQFFNWKYNRSGHLLQGRYKSYIIEKNEYLLQCSRYIVLNPCEAKLVEHPGQWPWSSYNATAGFKKPPPFLTTEWLLSVFGATVNKARQSYVKFIEAGMKEGGIKFEYKNQLFLGSDEFVLNILKNNNPIPSMTDINNTQMTFGRPSLDQLFDGKQSLIATRNKAIIIAFRKHKYKLKEIATYLRMNPNYLCDIVRKSEM